ncbi:MAG: hypothetical protein DMD79_20065 [Candidatus Rokuibacteriota bacterium]|nr:MAG: hypothetical protein DMD79_20065 [Candidatus Rokubacteria bacterium]
MLAVRPPLCSCVHTSISRASPTGRSTASAPVTAEEARDVTVAAEVSVMTGETLGPLHGVPVSMKDLLFTRRVPTTGEDRQHERPPEAVAPSLGPRQRDLR